VLFDVGGDWEGSARVLHNCVAELRWHAHLARGLRAPFLSKVKRLLLISFVIVMAVAVPAIPGPSSPAQVKKIQLTGRVFDANHAVIVFSEVTAQNAEGKNYWAVTNEEGVYKFELPLDEYRVEANAPGFCPKRIDLVRMRKPPAQKPLDFVLDMTQSDRPCAQKTMIKKASPRSKQGPPKNIAE
jgi:hypothetical protein